MILLNRTKTFEKKALFLDIHSIGTNENYIIGFDL
jgi:hypothetical protein